MATPARPLTAVRRLRTNWAGVTLLAVLIFLANLLGGSSDSSMTVFAGPDPALAPTDLHALSVNVWIGEPSRWQNVLGVFSGSFTSLLFSLPMLFTARRLVDSAADNQPFTPQVAGGLRRLGILVLILGAAAEAIQALAGYLAFHSAVPESAGFDYKFETPTLWWLVAGIIILAFAQIVRHGTTLRAELDEVI